MLLIVTLAAAVSGCSSQGAASESSANVAGDTAAAQSDGKQYRAVCLEAEAHGGNRQVLSRWLDERDKAFALGQYHGDFKDKGHRWVLEERVKPALAASSEPDEVVPAESDASAPVQ
jgi:hypothetical protein